MKIFVRSIILLVAIAGVVAPLPAQEDKSSKVEKGKTVFQETCTLCHSAGTEEKIGPALGGLTDGGKLPKSGKPVTRENLLELLEKGRPDADPMMPPFAEVLSKEEREAVVEYLMTL